MQLSIALTNGIGGDKCRQHGILINTVYLISILNNQSAVHKSYIHGVMNERSDYGEPEDLDARVAS